MLAMAAGPAAAQPTGGLVIAGQAQISTSGATTVINQNTSKAIISWQDFSVGQGAAVQFNQPNSASITLNRVTGTDLSAINGAIRANGQVWLLNPNGILFGSTATVNVGSLLATTSDIANQDFLEGRYNFSGGTGSVTNNGSIRAGHGGSVVLSAPNVTNNGLIRAHGGHVVLGGTDTFTVDFDGDRLLSYAVGSSSSGGNVTNNGAIKAAGGKVLLTAHAAAGVQDAVINNTGRIEAVSSREEDGEIVLDADNGGVTSSGTLDASGNAAGQTGGTVKVLGKDVALADGAKIDVSGDAGGGTVLIGGNAQGKGLEAHAQNTTIGKAAIKADAISRGTGGKVVVWSDGTTNVGGTITARGGATSGDGGQIETSGHVLGVSGTIDASAPHGSAGSWLLDPYNLTVSGGASSATQAPAGTWTSNAGGSVVANTDINAALNGGTSVVLQTSGALGDGNGNGDIFIASPIQMTGAAAASLTLKAAGGISVIGGISSTGGALGVTLDANTLGGGGYVSITSAITTNGGALVIGGGATPLTTPAVGTAAQIPGVLVNGALSTGGGAITINGIGYGVGAGNNNIGVQIQGPITSGGGAITITGTGGNTSGNFNYGIYQVDNITNSGAGTITLNGTGGGTGSSEDGFIVSGSSVNTAAGNGAILITGVAGAAATGTSNHGIAMAGGTVTSTGAITLNGTGGGTGAGGSDYGVLLNENGNIQTSGVLNISGTGGDNGGTGVGNSGIYMLKPISGTGGLITMTGTGGNSSGGNNSGITQTAALSNSGAGGITLSGTGGGTGSGDVGYNGSANLSTTGTGNIAITGIASATAALSGNYGIVLSTGTVSTTGTSTITLLGTGTGNGAGGTDFGVYLASGSVTAVDGLIRVTGISNSIGTGNSNFGVDVAGIVASTGLGGIALSGTGGGSGAGLLDIGVSWTSANVIQSTGGGPVTITGIGGDALGSGGNNYGVNIGGAISVSGNLTINGTGGNSSGTSNTGINQTTSSTVAATGANSITINGTGGGNGTNTGGFFVGANITAGTGNIAITGAPSAAASGGYGLSQNTGTISTAGAGTITLVGTATGNGASGVQAIFLGGGVTAANGLISITGTNNSTGTGSNAGVLVNGTIASSGAGGVTIRGTGGGTGASSGSYGVTLQTALQTSGGAITLVGTGGDNGGTGTYGIGVNATQAITSNGGLISITGTGGTSTAATPGISLAAVTAGSGTVVLTSPGTVVVSGALTAASLDLLGTGATYTLSNTANSVATIAANTGSLLYKQTGALNIGTVAGTTGLTTTSFATLSASTIAQSAGIIAVGLNVTSTAGAITLSAANNTVGGVVNLTASSSGLFNDTSSLTLGTSSAGGALTATTLGNLTLASGTTLSSSLAGGVGIKLSAQGNFINNSGPSALAARNGGVWQIYSAAPGNDVFGNLNSGNFPIWNTVYPANVTAAGNRYIFSSQPILTVAATNISKIYGVDGTTALASAFTVTGLQAGVSNAYLGATAAEAYSGTPSLTSTGAAATAPVNGVYTIAAAAGSLTGNDGYGVVFQNARLTVTPATLTYAATRAARSYGAANPALGGTVTGLVNGETLASATTGTLAFTTAATSASPVGSYAVNGFGLSAANYIFVQAAANASALTVNPAALVYVANAVARSYGGANPALGGTVTGLVNGDTLAAATTGALVFTTAATSASPVGSYAVSGSGLSAVNYTFAQAAANATALTVNPAALVYVANGAARFYGGANPALGGTVTGLVNGDTLAAATTGTLVFSTAATSASPVGSYAVNGSGLSAANYSFAQAPTNISALVIGPATLLYVANAASRAVNTDNPALDGVVIGFVGADTQSAATTGALAFATTAGLSSPAGSYPVNGSGLSATNYVFAQAGANATALTITLPPVTAATPGLAGFTAAALPPVLDSVSSTVLSNNQSSPTAPAPPPSVPPPVALVASAPGGSPLAADNTASDGKPAEAPNSSDGATSQVADSLDGGPAPSGAAGGGPVIPKMLASRPLPPRPPVDASALSSFGNLSLWQ